MGNRTSQPQRQTSPATVRGERKPAQQNPPAKSSTAVEMPEAGENKAVASSDPLAKHLRKAQKALALAASPAVADSPDLQRLAYQRAINSFETFFAAPQAKDHPDYAALEAQLKQAQVSLATVKASDDSEGEELSPPNTPRERKAQTEKKAQQTQPTQSIAVLPSASPIQSTSSSSIPTSLPTVTPIEATDESDATYEIFRYPTPVPDAEFVDVDRPIHNTQTLAAVLRQLPQDSSRREALSLLSLEIVNQFGLRLVRTPSLLRELTALAVLPQPELLHKILQQFVNRLKDEAALDVDLVEGLAGLLETAHPHALRASAPETKSAAPGEADTEVPEEPVERKDTAAPLSTRLKAGAMQAAASTLKVMDKALNEKTQNGASIVLRDKALDLALAGAKTLRDKVQLLLKQKGLISATPLKDAKETQDSQAMTLTPVSSNLQERQTPVSTHASRHNNIQYLLTLLTELHQQYASFHRQAQTEAQEVELLRTLSRVLDAVRDIGVKGMSQEKVRDAIYATLKKRADDPKASPTISLWANYAIQALIRIEDNGSNLGEWFQRGKKMVAMVGQLKKFWNNWDFEHLSDAYQNAQDAFHVDHQPEGWYEALWYAQLLIRSYEFQALETYLYGSKPCPERYAPTFQLGLLQTLDSVIRDSRQSERVRSGCLQLVQKLFLDESHWHCKVEEAKDSTVRGKVTRFVDAGKRRFLYTGRAYHLEAQAVQASVLEQLMQYLVLPGLHDSVQPLLLALRDPSITLSSAQTALLNRHAPLHKILQSNQAPPQSVPSTELLTAAQEVVQKQLLWKLENLRTQALSDVETQRVLRAYVPPKGLRKADDKDPPFDLLQASLAFLGLTSRDPLTAGAKAAAEKDPTDSFIETKASSPRRGSLLIRAADIAQCTVDMRRVPAGVDKAQILQWRQTYATQFTRFLVVLTQAQQPVAERRWYFCGQTGEGEWLEGELPFSGGTASPAFTALAQQLEPYRTHDDALTVLQEQGLTALKQTLIQQLGHVSVANAGQTLAYQEAQVLLLTAGAGSGKSTYGRYLEKYLWQHYSVGGYIPVFISLTQLPHPEKRFIDDYFYQLGFNPSDMAQLKDPKNSYRFLFVFDGYDELVNLKQQNLFKLNQLHEWPQCKVIIGCRSEALHGDYASWFAPQRNGQEFRSGLQERWVAPFDDTQIQNYLKKYVQQQREHQAQTGEVWHGWSDWTLYWRHIQAMGSIRQLVERPFMLTILVEVLPAMVKAREDSKSEGSLSNITRLDLYEMFIQQWFKHEKDKVSNADMQDAKHHGKPVFRFQEGEDLVQDYGEFCENLAAYLFKTKQLTANYQPRWEVGERGSKRSPQVLDHFFKTSDPAVRLVLRGTPIIPQGKNRFGYLHKSVWEYFVAYRIYHELSWGAVPWGVLSESPLPAQRAAHVALKLSRYYGKRETSSPAVEAKQALAQPAERVFKGMVRLAVGAKRLGHRLAERRVAQQAVHGLQERDSLKLLLNERLLTSEPSIVRFLADFVAREERFRRTLMYWVLASRTQPELAIASSNALTVLNAAHVPFSGLDLAGVRVPGADLSEGLFDHTNFTGADLRNVNFDNAFMRHTQLPGANAQGAFFESTSGQELETGELQGKDGVIFTPDRNTVFFIPKNGNDKSIRVYDIRARQWLTPIDLPAGEKITDVTFTADGRTAFLYTKWHGGSQQVTVYDAANRKPLAPIVPSEGETITTITATADGRIVFLYNCRQDLYNQQDCGSRQVIVYDAVNQKPLVPIVAPDGEAIDTVTVTADGRTAFLYNKEEGSQQVTVYDVAGQKLLDTFVAPDGEKINEVMLTADGRTAFLYDNSYGGGSRQVTVYDVAGQKLLASIVAPEDKNISRVALTADGRTAFLYGTTGNRQVVVYDVASQKPLAPVVAPEGEEINLIMLTADSRTAFLYDNNEGSRQVTVYDAANQKPLAPIVALSGEKINKITLTADSRTAFLYSFRCRQVTVYDVANQKPLAPIVALSGEEISEIRLTADGHTAFLYSEYGCQQVAVYDVANQKRLVPIVAPEGKEISDVTLTADGHTAFLYNVRGGSRQVGMYDCQKKSLSFLRFDEAITKVRVFKEQVYCVFFSYYRCYVFNFLTRELSLLHQMKARIQNVQLLENADLWIESESGIYQTWNWQRVEQARTTVKEAKTGHSASVYQVLKLSPDSYASSSAGESCFWRIQGSRFFFIDKGQQILPKDTDCVTDGRTAFFFYGKSGSEQVTVYDVANQKLLAPIVVPEDKKIYKVTLTADGRTAFLYGATKNRQVIVYDAANRKLLAPLVLGVEEINRVTLTADGRTTFLYHDFYGSQEMSVYDAVNQKLLAPVIAPSGEKINTITLTADGRTAFLYKYEFNGGSTEVAVYDVAKQKLLASIIAPGGEKINTITLTADGRTAFLYDNDNKGESQQVTVYDVANQKTLASIVAPSGEKIKEVTLTADGHTAFLYNNNNYGGSQQVTVYDVANQKLLAPIVAPSGEKINTVTLTADSCTAFLYIRGQDGWGGGGSQQVTVYDVANQKLLAPIVAPAGERVKEVRPMADSRTVFLYSENGDDGSQQVIVYDVANPKTLASLVVPKGETLTLNQDRVLISNNDDFVSCWHYRQSGEQRIQFPGINVQNFLDLPALSLETPHPQISLAKKPSLSSTLIETKATSPTQVIPRESGSLWRGLVLYGKGGCYLWSAQTNTFITLLKGSEVTAVEFFGNGTQLVTAGQDATLRLWDISNLERPLLKDCTQGMTFYAQGAQFDEHTQLSDDNCRVLQTRGAVKQGMSKAGLSQLTGSERPPEAKKELKSAYERPSDDSPRGNVSASLPYATSSVVFFQEGRRASLESKRSGEAKSQHISSAQTVQMVDTMAKPKSPPEDGMPSQSSSRSFSS